jgi:hypothetical protein
MVARIWSAARVWFRIRASLSGSAGPATWCDTNTCRASAPASRREALSCGFTFAVSSSTGLQTGQQNKKA